MSGQAVHLFVNVHAHGVERDFLADPFGNFFLRQRSLLRERLRQRIFKACGEFGLQLSKNLRNSRTDFFNDGRHLVHIAVDDLGERSAFTFTGGDEAVQGLVEHGKNCLQQFVLIRLSGMGDARHFKDF